MIEPVFVLVHGAWVGGWNWRYVEQRLRDRGHAVFTPSLSGLGDRAHLMSPEVNLSTHIADILGIIESYELEHVVLAGHSYGGMVISGVAAQAAEKIKALVYLDAFLPEDGQCALDLLSPERRAQFEGAAAERGDGWRIPPIPAEVWGIDDRKQAAWVDRHSVDQPLAAMREPVSLSGRETEVERRIYVRASGYDPSPFKQFADRVETDPAWTLRSVDSHHFLNVAHPDEVAAILTVTAAGV
jgi:pimeloyl-ACP methyl ester carboxylesterase